jgi:hypothetical protein
MTQSTESRTAKIIESTTAAAARLSRLLGRLSRAGSLIASTRLLLNDRPSIVLPGARLPGRPGLLLLTTLLLGLLCVVLTFRVRSSSQPTDELVLLSGPSSPNLNNSSGETPARALASPAAVGQGSPDPSSDGSAPPAEPAVNRATPTPAAHEALGAPFSEPVLPPPTELSPHLAVEETLPGRAATVAESAREKCYPIRGPLLGDTPMMRTWQMLGLKTLLAALFAAAPALSSETSGPPSDTEKFTEIQKQLNGLQKSLTEIKKGLEDVKAEKTLSAENVQRQITDLYSKISQLRSDLELLRNRPAESNRIGAYPPSDTSVNTATARIDMINTYSQPVSIVINRRSYPLAPGEHRLSDPIPAGAFTYEVLGVTPVTTRTVAADKVFTLWVHPQP